MEPEHKEGKRSEDGDQTGTGELLESRAKLGFGHADLFGEHLAPDSGDAPGAGPAAQRDEQTLLDHTFGLLVGFSSFGRTA